MDRPNPSRCRSCKAPIYWARTPENKRIPIDAEPVDDGNIAMIMNRATGELSARVLTAGEHRPLNRNFYVSHFTTCPQAKRWRK